MEGICKLLLTAICCLKQKAKPPVALQTYFRPGVWSFTSPTQRVTSLRNTPQGTVVQVCKGHVAAQSRFRWLTGLGNIISLDTQIRVNNQFQYLHRARVSPVKTDSMHVGAPLNGSRANNRASKHPVTSGRADAQSNNGLAHRAVEKCNRDNT